MSEYVDKCAKEWRAIRAARSCKRSGGVGSRLEAVPRNESVECEASCRLPSASAAAAKVGV